jgi:hypothetical protein
MAQVPYSENFEKRLVHALDSLLGLQIQAVG